MERRKERIGEDVETGFSHKEANARDKEDNTILGLASRSGKVVTSRTFHRLSFGSVGTFVGVNAGVNAELTFCSFLRLRSERQLHARYIGHESSTKNCACVHMPWVREFCVGWRLPHGSLSRASSALLEKGLSVNFCRFHLPRSHLRSTPASWSRASKNNLETSWYTLSGISSATR